MNKLLPAAFLVLAALPARADSALMANAAQIQALEAQAQAQAKTKGASPLVSENIFTLAPYRVNLEYRTAEAPAAVHETEAELMLVLDGSGTLIEGGTLVDGKRTNAANLSGPSIAGGTSHAFAKGDFAFVPQNTPHQLIPAKGGTLVLMTLHVPRTTEDRSGAKTFATAAEVASLRAKAKGELKPGANMTSETIVNLAPYRVALEFRTGGRPAGASLHKAAAELMIGLSGTGTVTTNGTLTDPRPASPGNLAGSGITAGTVHDMAEGDFLFVPENTPHQIIAANGGDFVLMTLHVPRPVPK